MSVWPVKSCTTPVGAGAAYGAAAAMRVIAAIRKMLPSGRGMIEVTDDAGSERTREDPGTSCDRPGSSAYLNQSRRRPSGRALHAAFSLS